MRLRKTQCRKTCNGKMRPICYVSNLSRLALAPLVWWAIAGFGDASGYRWLRDAWSLSTPAAAAITALCLATVSTAALLPCSIHRRILRGRAARCACEKPAEDSADGRSRAEAAESPDRAGEAAPAKKISSVTKR